MKVKNQGPDAELVITFKEPKTDSNREEPNGYILTGDLEGRTRDGETTFSIEKSMLGRTLEFAITPDSSSGEGESITVTFEVPQTALDIDYSAWKEPDEREWALIVKNPDKYLGDKFVVYAEISQFDAATGEDTFRADAYPYNTGSIWIDGDNCLFTGSARELEDYVEDDVVRVWVTSLGSFSYDTQIGGTTTVPLFSVDKIELA